MPRLLVGHAHAGVAPSLNRATLSIQETLVSKDTSRTGFRHSVRVRQ